LEQKGLLSKTEILEAIRELRRQNPTARTPLEIEDLPDQAFPEPYLITEAEDALITHIMDTMNGAKLATHRMLRSGYMNAKDNIVKDIRAWDCYPVPEPKKKEE